MPDGSGLVLRFGEQLDTQTVNSSPAGELTPEHAARYIAKYATKSAEDFGLGDRRISPETLPLLGVSNHAERLVRLAWQLGEHESYDGLRQWVHMLGFCGHFASNLAVTRPRWAPSGASVVPIANARRPSTRASCCLMSRTPHSSSPTGSSPESAASLNGYTALASGPPPEHANNDKPHETPHSNKTENRERNSTGERRIAARTAILVEVV
jgi:hypothetical protein